MPGSGSANRAVQRNHVLAIRCAKLSAQGWSHRNIAEQVGKNAEQIKSLILLGERLQSIEVKESAHD